jgi:hypothetical protein
MVPNATHKEPDKVNYFILRPNAREKGKTCIEESLNYVGYSVAHTTSMLKIDSPNS